MTPRLSLVETSSTSAGVRLLQRIEHLAHALAGEQIGGVLAHRLHEMGGEHRLRFHHAVAAGLGLETALRGDPDRRYAEAGVGGVDPLERNGAAAGVEREKVSRHHLAAGHLDPPQLDHVLRGRELDVVTDARGRHDDPELERHLLPHDADALKQVALLALVHQRHQGVADFDLERLHRQHFADLGRGSAASAAFTGAPAGAGTASPASRWKK